MTDEERAEFVDGYVTCLIWSNTDDDISAMYGEGLAAMSPEAQRQCREECSDFLDGLAEPWIRQVLSESYTWSSAGHDFALTRNGHGAGFWDRGLGAIGDELTQLAATHGSADVWFNEDTMRLEVE